MGYATKENPFPKPVPPSKKKYRGFLGIDQSLDENDLDPAYSDNAHNVDYSRATIRCAPGVSISDYAQEYHPTADGAIFAPYVLHTFYQRDTSGVVRVWLVATAQEVGTNKAGVWVRYVPEQDWNSPIHPETWQKILDIPKAWGQPAETNTHSKWNFINYQDGNKGWLIFTAGGQDLYKWDGSYTGTTANQATKLYYSSATVHAPQGTLIALYKERVVVAGVAADPDSIYFSNALNPDDWIIDENNPDHAAKISIPTWDGEGITALVALNDELLIFKNNRLLRLSGSAPSDYAITEIAKVGVSTQMNVVTWSEMAYFISSVGLVSFDGTNLQTIADTRKIASLQTEADYVAAGNESIARLFVWNNKLIISTLRYNYGFDDYVGESRKVEPQVIEYNLMTGAISFRVDQCLWYRTDVTPPQEMGHNYFYGAITLDGELLCTAHDTIFVYDDGANTLREYHWDYPETLHNDGYVHMFHSIPATDFGVATKKKRVSKIAVSGKGGTVKITPVCDGVAKRPITLELPTDYAVLKPKIVIWFGRKIGFWVENVDGDAVEVTDIELEYHLTGG